MSYCTLFGYQTAVAAAVYGFSQMNIFCFEGKSSKRESESFWKKVFCLIFIIYYF